MKENLYHKILGIEGDVEKIHFYILLGVKTFESDPQLIHKAGLARIKKLREWQLHPDPEIAKFIQEMLNQVSRACTTLEVSEKKHHYDSRLAEDLGVAAPRQKLHIPTIKTKSYLKTCPNCGSKASELAMICIECGYNFETGEKLEMVIEKASFQELYLNKESLREVTEGVTQWIGTLIAFAIKGFYVLVVIGLLVAGYMLYPKIKQAFNRKTSPESIFLCSGEPYSYRNDCLQAMLQNKEWKLILEKFSTSEKIKPPYFNIKLKRPKGETSDEYLLTISNVNPAYPVCSETIFIEAQNPAEAEKEWKLKIKPIIITAAYEVIKRNYRLFNEEIDGMVKKAADTSQNESARIFYIRFLGDLPEVKRGTINTLQRLAENRNESKQIRDEAVEAYRKIEKRKMNR